MSFQPLGISAHYSLAAAGKAAYAEIAQALRDELRLVPALGTPRE